MVKQVLFLLLFCFFTQANPCSQEGLPALGYKLFPYINGDVSRDLIAEGSARPALKCTK